MIKLITYIQEQLVKHNINPDHDEEEAKFLKYYVPDKVKATGDTIWKWYKKGLEKNFPNYMGTSDDDFINNFAKIFYPGEGEIMGYRYLCHYLYLKYNVHLIEAWNYGVRGLRHFTFFYTTEDAPRKVIRGKLSKENSAFETQGGFHGKEEDIHFFGSKKIKNRKDFAAEILKTVKATLDEKP